MILLPVVLKERSHDVGRGESSGTLVPLKKKVKEWVVKSNAGKVEADW